MYLYPHDTLEKLEFDAVRRSMADLCRNPAAAARMLSAIPLSHPSEIETHLAETSEYLNTLANNLSFPDPNCEDISRELALLNVPGSVLQEKMFMDIKAVADSANRLTSWLKDKKEAYPALYARVEHLEPDEYISSEIDAVLDMHGIVRSNASHELSSIRSSLAKTRREHDRMFNQALDKCRKAGMLAETGETFINGRRVLSLLSENKREIKGIIHGYSKTGKATFIEPGETVETGNEITLLESEEKREIHRILRELTQIIRTRKPILLAFFELLIHMEFTRSKARWALQHEAVVPLFLKTGGIRLMQAVHPLLFINNRKNGKPTVPLNVVLDTRKSILIISGPNAGGKSVALKTVGLLQLMVQSGMPVTADARSEFGYFRNLLTDIGDNQSIEYELSTYSSRLLKMNHFLKRAGKQTLFLIDEFGTGTDPELGGAMAEVILEELAASQSFGVITTHYGNLKIAGEKLDTVENACMLFDDQTLEPLYTLETGKPGSSYTFVIAAKSGLPKALIGRAKQKVSGEKVRLDGLLNSLQLTRNRLNEELKKASERTEMAEKAKAAFEEKKDRMDEKWEKLKANRDEEQKLMELGRKMKALSEDWEKEKDKKKVIAKFVKQAGREKAKQTAEREKKKKEYTRERIIARKLEVIHEGSSVRLKGGKEIGKVTALKGSKAKVQFGIIMMDVSVENLDAIS
jgi:DNA mismatch repair protein MutS2